MSALDIGGDHPRIRGEHVIPSRNVNGVTGSSPHTRGAPGRTAVECSRRGIIPAYAGSTVSVERAVIKSADHPRIRGEHARFGRILEIKVGSSPHTRGARSAPKHTIRTEGIIPAYAGSTRKQLNQTLYEMDHPRIRGEHVHAGYEVPVREGSSPHTRGAQRLARARDRVLRIIPAYAGSTSLGSRTRI